MQNDLEIEQPDLDSEPVAAVHQVWIMSKHGRSEYENDRLCNEFEAAGISHRLIQPQGINIIVGDAGTVVLVDGRPCELPELVLTRTGSGSDYYTLSVLEHLESLGVHCMNSSRSIRVVMDKWRSACLLSAYAVPTPKTVLLRLPCSTELVIEQIGFPCVVKVVTGSYGKGVHLCTSRQSLDSLVDMISAVSTTTHSLLAQQFIAERFGSDLRVWIIDGKVMGAMLRSSANGDFRANISKGGVGVPFPLDDQIIAAATSCALALGLDIAGVDLLFTSTGYTVCEANSAPGFSGFEKFCGINIAAMIVASCRDQLRNRTGGVEHAFAGLPVRKSTLSDATRDSSARSHAPSEAIH